MAKSYNSRYYVGARNVYFDRDNNAHIPGVYFQHKDKSSYKLGSKILIWPKTSIEKAVKRQIGEGHEPVLEFDFSRGVGVPWSMYPKSPKGFLSDREVEQYLSNLRGPYSVEDYAVIYLDENTVNVRFVQWNRDIKRKNPVALALSSADFVSMNVYGFLTYLAKSLRFILVEKWK